MNSDRLGKIIDSFKDLRVVVVGDIMLDRYLRGSATRQSPEADVPILDHESTSTKLGGAANVALNYKALTADVSLLSVCGNDSPAKECKMLLEKADIKHFLVSEEARPTTVKTRIITNEKHLLRVDFETTNDISHVTTELLTKKLDDLINSVNPHLMVIQDYNKGLLTKEFIGTLLQKAKSHQIFVAVDPKINNFWEYKGVSFFKPNLRETSIALNQNLINLSEYENAAKTLQTKLSADMIALTLSEHGILIFNGSKICHSPVLPVSIVDVCGAGDAVLVITSLMAYNGFSTEEIGYLGNLVGAQVCQISGVGLIDQGAMRQLIMNTA